MKFNYHNTKPVRWPLSPPQLYSSHSSHQAFPLSNTQLLLLPKPDEFSEEAKHEENLNNTSRSFIWDPPLGQAPVLLWVPGIGGEPWFPSEEVWVAAQEIKDWPA